MSESCWDNEEVVRGHVENMEREYEAWKRARAMIMGAYVVAEWRNRIDKDMVTIADLGCGAGPYLLPFMTVVRDFRYAGFDASQAMIDHASRYWSGPRVKRDVQIEFSVKRIENASSDDGDLFFVCGPMEYCEEPYREMLLFLQKLRPGQVFVFQKLRLSPAPGGAWITEPTYAGKRAQVWLWGPSVVKGIVERFTSEYHIYQWPQDPTISIAGVCR